LGHELSGVVTDVPAQSSFKVGDRVAVYPLLPCKSCPACRTGDYAQCIQPHQLGTNCDGGMAEFIRVPAENLFRLPDHVKTLHAAMVEPAAVALHAVRKLHIRAGDTAAVFGAGPLGNLVAQWLRLHGCRRVILIDSDEIRLAVAARMGFETIYAL